MKEFTRQQDLVLEIANYLTDWTNDETSVMSEEESIEIIESYGVKFDNPCDDLVVNAIKHLDNIINPWNKAAAIPEILEVIGFNEEEIKRYNHVTDSVIRIQFR